MLLDDQLDNPMTFVVQFELSGELNEAAMQRALQNAMSRHPLLAARIGQAKGGKECWVAAEEHDVEIDFAGLDSPIDLDQGEHLDLRQHSGVRLWVRKDEQRALLTGQFHHASCDGIGAYQFLGDLLWYYAIEIGDRRFEPLPPIQQRGLRERGIASFDPSLYGDNGKFRPDYKELARMFGWPIRPLEVGRRKKQHRLPAGYPGIVSHTFSKDEFKQFRLAMLDVGLTTNDALVEGMFHAVQAWNESGRRRWLPESINVMVPMDLRVHEGMPPSAANCVTYAMLRHLGSTVRDRHRLRELVRSELTDLKHNRHRTRFMNLMALARKNPRTAAKLLGLNRCIVSAVLSNTGDPTRNFNGKFPKRSGAIECGNLLLEDISGVPPLRVKTRATVSIFTYRRRLKICVRCDARRFTLDDTQAFLDLYIGELQRETRRIAKPAEELSSAIGA